MQTLTMKNQSRHQNAITSATPETVITPVSSLLCNLPVIQSAQQDPVYAESFVSFNKYNIDLELFLLNRTSSVLKNVCISFYSVASEQKNSSLRLLDKLRTPYLMPDQSTILFKTLNYDASKEFQLFAEISYQNNAVSSSGHCHGNS